MHIASLVSRENPLPRLLVTVRGTRLATPSLEMILILGVLCLDRRVTSRNTKSGYRNYPVETNRGDTVLSTSITVRDIDPADKSWLKREARLRGISVAEFVRRMIHEKREKTESRPKPSEAFALYFGERHGIELPAQSSYGYKSLSLSTED